MAGRRFKSIRLSDNGAEEIEMPDEIRFLLGLDSRFEKKEDPNLHAAYERVSEQVGPSPDFTVHKVALPATAGKIKLPLGGTVVHAGEQHGALFAWYIFPADCEVFQTVAVAVLNTGQRVDYEFKESMQYFRTVQMVDGLVKHIFFGQPVLDPL